MNGEDVTILWNTKIHKDRYVAVNKQNILIKEKIRKTCIAINVVTPVNDNIPPKLI